MILPQGHDGTIKRKKKIGLYHMDFNRNVIVRSNKKRKMSVNTDFSRAETNYYY